MNQEPNYEKPGWHLFEDDVNQFEVFLQRMITDTTIDIEEQTWKTMLGVYTRLSCGALYDNISKKFFLLGPEQVNLRDSSEHNLMDPRIIQGVAGTGKTITCAAKIEILFKDGKITPSSKALYLCYSSQMVEQMSQLLKKAGVDMTNIKKSQCRFR